MSAKSHIDDYTNFHYRWISTAGENSYIVDDKGKMALGVKLRRSTEGQSFHLDLRKKFPDFFKKEDITITFRMSAPEGVEIKEFTLRAIGGNQRVHIPFPPSDGKWHQVQARLPINESDLKELWIQMNTAPILSEQVLVGFNDIHVVQH